MKFQSGERIKVTFQNPGAIPSSVSHFGWYLGPRSDQIGYAFVDLFGDRVCIPMECIERT